MERSMEAIYVKVRNFSDLSWVNGTNGVLYVKPSPTLSRREMDLIRRDIDMDFYPHLDWGFRFLGNMEEGRSLCVTIHSINDYRKVIQPVVAGAENKIVYIATNSQLPDSFREEMRLLVPNIGVYVPDSTNKKFFQNARGCITAVAKVCLIFVVIQALIGISFGFQKSDKALVNLGSLSFPEIKILNLKLDEINLTNILGCVQKGERRRS